MRRRSVRRRRRRLGDLGLVDDGEGGLVVHQLEAQHLGQGLAHLHLLVEEEVGPGPLLLLWQQGAQHQQQLRRRDRAGHLVRGEG